MERKVFACLALLLCLGASAQVYGASAGNSGNSGIEILYESRRTSEISRGVTYVDSRMMTDRGMLDVHALVIDIQQPYITLAPVINRESLGLKETALNMLRDAGAVAGVNADYFGLAGDYSVHFGPMARAGELVALNPGVNAEDDDDFFGTFFLDMLGNAFFAYVTGEAWLYINEERAVPIHAYNTIGRTLWGPVLVDRNSMADTAAIAERFDGLSFIIVEDGEFAGHTAPNELVEVPENGFLVVLPRLFNNEAINWLREGDRLEARFAVRNEDGLRVDFSRIEAAVGGGGVVMRGGREVEEIFGAFPPGRNPRTAIGTDYRGRIVMMVVDGRTHSVGVDSSELVAMLRRFGVTDAISLDGGGSSTMVVSRHGEGHRVANTVSEGAERRIVNALGVFDTSRFRDGFGAPTRIALRPRADFALVHSPLGIDIVFVDDFGNAVELPEMDGDFTVTHDPAAGEWRDGRYTPFRAGEHIIEAQYGDFRGRLAMTALETGSLSIRPGSLRLEAGESAEIEVAALSGCGRTVAIPDMDRLVVSPSSLGFFDGSTFVAAEAGSGFIMAQVGAVQSFIPVAVGGVPFPQSVPENTGFRDRLWAGHDFQGFPGGQFFRFAVSPPGWDGPTNEVAYEVMEWGDFILVYIPTENGGIAREHWAVFMDDIREHQRVNIELRGIGRRNIVVITETFPLEFRQPMEYELFHRAMTELVDEGMRVFVISASAQYVTPSVRDEVRYINLSPPDGPWQHIFFFTLGDQILWG